MSYPTKKSHKCKKISSLDQSRADSQLRIFCSNFLWRLLTIFQCREKFIFLSFFEEKRFVYLQKGSLSQGQLEFFCWQMYSKWEEKYFYSLAYDRMRLLKNFLDVSISLPSKNSNATDWSLCECLQNGRTLFSIISKTFLNDGAFFSGGEVFCIPLGAVQKGPTDFINTLREWVRDKTLWEA